MSSLLVVAYAEESVRETQENLDEKVFSEQQYLDDNISKQSSEDSSSEGHISSSKKEGSLPTKQTSESLADETINSNSDSNSSSLQERADSSLETKRSENNELLENNIDNTEVDSSKMDTATKIRKEIEEDIQKVIQKKQSSSTQETYSVRKKPTDSLKTYSTIKKRFYPKTINNTLTSLQSNLPDEPAFLYNSYHLPDISEQGWLGSLTAPFPFYAGESSNLDNISNEVPYLSDKNNISETHSALSHTFLTISYQSWFRIGVVLLVATLFGLYKYKMSNRTS